MPAIQTRGLTKRYGSTLALDDLDLTVEEGEVYGYLGPNGAGKTTTIRLLLGLHRPSSGRAELFGLDAWRDAVAAHRRAAYVAGTFDIPTMVKSVKDGSLVIDPATQKGIAGLLIPLGAAPVPTTLPT